MDTICRRGGQIRCPAFQLYDLLKHGCLTCFSKVSIGAFQSPVFMCIYNKAAKSGVILGKPAFRK